MRTALLLKILYVFSYLFFLKQFKELVESRQDHDTGAAVGSAAFFCIIRRNGNILATTGSSDMSRIQSILILQDLDNGSSAFYAEIPVILQLARSVVGFVIGM